MSIFGDLNKKAKQSRDRWKEIEDLSSKLKELTGSPGAPINDIIKVNSQLLVLLVEQFKPISDLESLDAENIIKEIFNSIPGDKNKDGK